MLLMTAATLKSGHWLWKMRREEGAWVRLMCVAAALKLLQGALKRRRRAAAGEEEGTWVGKPSLQVLLALVAGWYDVVCFKQYKCYANMMTGNTLTMCMALGNRNYKDAGLLAGAVANFAGGFTLFKYLELRWKGKGTTTAVAPMVLALFALADHYRRKYPGTRKHVLLLAIAGGIVNAVSAERAKIVTNMLTGHYQKLCGDTADLLHKGVSEEQKQSAYHSLRVIAVFCTSFVAAAAAWNVDHQYHTLSKHRFTAIGAVYAALLVLHEMPVGWGGKEKNE